MSIARHLKRCFSPLPISFLENSSLGRRQVVRQRPLEPPFVGSNPSAPASIRVSESGRVSKMIRPLFTLNEEVKLEEEVKVVRKLREKLTDEGRREREKQDARKAAEGEERLDAMIRRSIELHGP